MEKPKKLGDFPEEKENPFVKGLVVPSRMKTNVIATKNGGVVLNTKTGEIDEDTLFLAQKKFLDKEPFVKLFQSQLKALFNLSQAGVRVFGYLMEQTKFDDMILFDWKECQTFTCYNSTSTISRGLVELLDAGFIAKTSKTNLYFINPQIFFKGDRIVLIQEYRKKKAPADDTNQLKISFGDETPRTFTDKDWEEFVEETK